MDLYLFAGGHKINSWPFLLINNLFFLILKIKKINKSSWTVSSFSWITLLSKHFGSQFYL